MKNTRFLILDTETTGLYPEDGDKIIEIGIVEIYNNKKTGNNFHKYINPNKLLTEDNIAIHNITNDFLKDKPLFKDIANELLDFIQQKDTTIVAHNANFDMKFINIELKNINIDNISNIPIIDTVVLSRKESPGKPANLDAICTRMNIDLEERRKNGHGAMLDANLLAEIFINFTEKGILDRFLNNEKIEIKKQDNILQNRYIYNDLINNNEHEEFLKKLKINNIW
jgi:DNA polymerase-3 subunit epsilon